MAIASGSGLLTNPRSPAQTRALIAALKQKDSAVEADVAQLLTDVEALQGQADPRAAVFDSTMGIGAPVRIVATGNAEVAQANSLTNANVAGVVFTGAAAAATGEYVPQGGRVSQADWTAVIGSASLTPGAVYFLSATAGQLTTTAPTTTGQIVLAVGIALTSNIFQVRIGLGILL